jgi:hypothetical protein
MGKTAAERQKEYRAQRDTCHGGEGERRLQAWVSTATDLALDRLAARYSLTRKQVIERLILEADALQRNNVDGEDDFLAYLDGPLQPNVAKP